MPARPPHRPQDTCCVKSRTVATKLLKVTSIIFKVAGECGAETLKGTSCRRRARTVPCYQHRGWRGSNSPGSGNHAVNSARRAAGGPTGRLPGKRWRQQARDRACVIAGRSSWPRGSATASIGGCEDLARLARSLLEANAGVQREAAEVVANCLAGNRSTALVRDLAAGLLAVAPPPPLNHVKQVARGVQLLGILVCTTTGVPAAHCACLHDLHTELGQDGLDQAIEGQFSALVT